MRLFHIFFIFLFFGSIFLGAHFFLIDRLGFWRLIYPAQAQAAIWSINCSNDAPRWMPQSVKYIIQKQKNLSNQLAFIDKDNKIHTCQSGWKKTTIFSDRLDSNTRFRYASLTKIFTHDAIIELINEQKIKLDDRMVVFFPELNNQSFKDVRIKNITISELLQQRSGFDRMSSEDVMFSTTKTPWCPNNLEILLNLELDFEPNHHYGYDNRNSCLLGAIIERVTKKSYRDYINTKYLLKDKSIYFVNGRYYPDEVHYDFRNSDFWVQGDDNSFKFKEISSSAGLSGSAKNLTLSIKKMLRQQPLNILDIANDNLNTCRIYEFKSCNGYAMWQYRENPQKNKMYFRNGGLPAATSLAMVTENDEVIVWIGNGASLYNKHYDENLLEKYFYKVLNK